jgi:hypothetical protein
MCSPAQQPAALRLLHAIGLHCVMPYSTLMHPTANIAPLRCASLHGAPLQRAPLCSNACTASLPHSTFTFQRPAQNPGMMPSHSVPLH